MVPPTTIAQQSPNLVMRSTGGSLQLMLTASSASRADYDSSAAAAAAASRCIWRSCYVTSLLLLLLLPKLRLLTMLLLLLQLTSSARTVLPIGNILASLLATFAAFGRHCLLWPKATTFERSQRPYLWSSAPKVRCGQRPQQLKGHS